jgi:hypothetical protein
MIIKKNITASYAIIRKQEKVLDSYYWDNGEYVEYEKK